MFQDGSVKALSSASEACVCRRAVAQLRRSRTARSPRTPNQTEPLEPRTGCRASVAAKVKQRGLPKDHHATVSLSTQPMLTGHCNKCTAGVPAADCCSKHCKLQSFPLERFHVLFDSLFKVLFIFPSRYLFAIGLVPIFSLR